MSEAPDIPRLLAGLEQEISRASAGSTEGQFPILDLLGNLRDAARKLPAGPCLAARAEQAWEHLVRIVESGQPFSAADVAWLQGIEPSLADAFAGLTASETSSAASPVAPGEPRPEFDPAPGQESDSTGWAAAPAEIGPGPQLPDAGEEALRLNLPDDADLLREFLNESREHLDNIEQGVLVLERQPTDGETISTIFRAFHTFKGSAGFLNLMPINRLAHVLETLLDLVRQHQLPADSGVIELILRGRDRLKQFLDAIEHRLAETSPATPILIETAALKAELQATIAGALAPASLPRPEATATAPPPARPLTATQPARPAALPGETAPAERSAEHNAAAVRVDTAKLDALLDLIGEMVISQSLVSQALTRLAAQDSQSARNIAQLARTTKELQRVGMSMRMVPVRGVFQKMARAVRDLSAKQNKQVRLVTTGEETELDRGVVEELNDPLLHMIRNSVDHGIEPEERRLHAAKPAVGTIHLRAYHQSGNIVLEIEDDGAGLNRERILAKAIEQGLTTPAARLADEEICRFIFAAGFSTAEKVTDVSGRGVGLDVVRRNIERLRGCIDIHSTPGRGSCFKITLPLTLAIIDGLVLRVGDERYIIPTLSVRESFRARPEMLTRIHNRAEVVNVRGRLLPLLRLYEHFCLQPASTDPSEGIVIVAQAGSECRCLLVDSLESKQEVVIKSLNELMVHKNHSLAGAAILGDGRVGLILDVNTLVHLEPQLVANACN